MGFRQHNSPPTTWRRKLREELLAAGLPDFVVDDDSRWNYVLLHGYDHQSGWSPAWITPEQARELLRLIGLHCEASSSLWLFQALEQRAGAREPA
jgi:hypothetical protein